MNTTSARAHTHSGAAGSMQAEQVMDEIRSGVIETVIVGGCDTNGLFRSKRMSSERFAREADPLMNMSEYMFGMDISGGIPPRPENYDGLWPSMDTGLADLEAVPDMSSLRRVPWLERTAMVLCDYRHPGGGADYEFSPRSMLRQVLRRCEELGFEPQIAPELEFVVFRETEQSIAAKGYRNLEPLDQGGGAFGSIRATRDSHIISKVVAGLKQARVPIDIWNSENSPGQYELNIEHGSALEVADQGFVLKVGVKEICALEGVTATFMSKLTSSWPGNSMHINQSLWRDGEPAFYDADADDGMSQLMRNYIAGQLRTIIPFTPIFSPSPAAFKRVAPHAGPSTSVSWGRDNKMCALRALSYRGSACRIEHRQAGADANIYLVLAAMLAGGLYGIENELEPPDPTTGDAYSNTELESIPRTFEDVLSALEDSAVANEYLGEEFVQRYAATRRWEAELARKEVTDWEFERYLLSS